MKCLETILVDMLKLILSYLKNNASIYYLPGFRERDEDKFKRGKNSIFRLKYKMSAFVYKFKI